LKIFATELKGKTVMTEDGEILGVLADLIMDTRTGRIGTLLVSPAASVETRLYKTDPQGRLLLEFKAMRSIRDVIIAQVAEGK